MTSLEDNLRATLRARAESVAPLGDVLARVEIRARGLRRRRTVSAVVAGVAVLAGVSVAVPLLDRGEERVSFAGPSPAPSAAPSASAVAGPPQAFDPARPWEYRGDPSVLNGLGSAAPGVWGDAHGVDDIGVAPLFGQVYEPSGRAELVFVATTDRPYLVVARAAPAGTSARPELLLDVPLPSTPVLALALPGDEAARLLLLAGPQVTTLQYGPDSASEFSDLAALAPGVGTGPLDGNLTTDLIRAATPDGTEVYRGPAPDPAGADSTLPRPDNALDWPTRGTVDPALEARAVRAFATAFGDPGAVVGHTVLFAGANDSGQRYVVLQAWLGDGPAFSFAWIETPGRDPEPVLQPAIAADEKVVAILLTGIPGRTTDELVVVPVPGTGQVLYRPTANGRFAPVSDTGLEASDGVVLVGRERGADGDAIRLLDGDGRTDRPPLFEGTVFDLLCGINGCG